MEETGTEKSYHVIPFDGKDDSWRMWSKKFLARAQMRGYKNILLGKVDVPPHDEVFTGTAAEKATKEALRAGNDKAYNDLLLACESDICFNLVDEAQTSDLPEGDARLAWNNLVNKYEPKSSMAKVYLKKEFAKCNLGDSSKDPNDWITELEVLRQRLKCQGEEINNEDFIIHILNNLTSDYNTLVEVLEDEVGDATNPLTIERLKEKLQAKFKRLGKTEGKDEDAALVVTPGNFKGRCNTCGVWGHKSRDCKEKGKKSNYKNNQSKEKRFNGKCNYCKIFGHKEIDCFKKKRDNKNESANTTIDSEKFSEIVLMGSD
jgi:hypothetical protein